MSARTVGWPAATGMLMAVAAGVYFLSGRYLRAPDSAIRGDGDIEPPSIASPNLPPQAARAVSAARAAVLKDPASAGAWGRLGSTYMAHDYPNEALTCFEAAARRQPREFRWVYLSGILLEDSDQDRAERSFAAARAIRPDYAPLRWRRGNLYLRLDRLDAARTEFETAAELARESPYPLLGLGHVELACGDEKRARQRFEAAVEVAPRSRDASNELASLLRRLGEGSRAWELQQQASRLPPAPQEMSDPVRQEVYDYGEASRSLAIQADLAAVRGELRQAIGLLRQLVSDYPELSRPRVNAGQLLLAQGDVTSALVVFRDAVDRFPLEPLAHYGLANACEASGAEEQAIREYRRACELKPDYVESHYRLGILLRRQGANEEACLALGRVVAAEPRLAAAHLALGLVLRDLGEFDRAREQLLLAVRLAPSDPEPARQLEEFSAAGYGDPPLKSGPDPDGPEK